MTAASTSPTRPTERRRRGSRLSGSDSGGRFDQRLLMLVTLALVAFGLVMVYSATSASAALGNEDPMSFLKRQAVYALLGIVVMAVASRFDYHRLRYFAPGLLVAALVLCAAVLVVAPAINGAHRWFLVGPASFQPSEVAKLALCLFNVLLTDFWRVHPRRWLQPNLIRFSCTS